MIRIEKISKKINGRTVFEDISLHLNECETYVLVGPNGVGKTSLLKSIAGLYSVDSGSVTVLGEKVTGSYKMNSKAGVFLDTARMLPYDKVRESLNFFASMYDRSVDDVQELIHCLHLENELNKTYNSLSSGNKRKVGLLFSLINDPELIIWDEPFAALDPEMCSELVEFIKALRKKGKTILLTTNDLYNVNNLFDRMTLLTHVWKKN